MTASAAAESGAVASRLFGRRTAQRSCHAGDADGNDDVGTGRLPCVPRLWRNIYGSTLMAHPGMIFLMYHELEMGKPRVMPVGTGICPVHSAGGDVSKPDEVVAAGGRARTEREPGAQVSRRARRVHHVRRWLRYWTDSPAAPILRDLNLNATFYLTAGFLGKPGYLSAEQARELDAAGFEIGLPLHDPRLSFGFGRVRIETRNR